ncbi:hypothetical protein LTR78_008480 [Recurvomyces mirabilis]|uniref:Aminotransferase class V domain-containing protein n=1 Tax=Recurvomyces mirabilis TaxID=574656 RepID=A0AAE0TUK4_9PEZI|nr:hypothetical protein LTR78_008480 [Recurvomyces mirabilis]KAK5156232.1 hypothetical protein LTS14_005119 [Recurvomyces mirabilis]
MNGPKISDNDTVECGAEAAKHFLFADGWRNLNHGSFGTYPKAIRDVQRQFQDDVEARPDAWLRHIYPDLLDKAREAVAEYLHAPTPTIVFIPNASTGVNTVLRNLVFEQNDVIIYAATTYGACELTIDYIVETTPAEKEKVDYTLPCPDEDLVAAFSNKITALKQAGKNVRVAVFDTIVSMPGYRLPFERLTALCREQGVLSCIDGAHGIGHISLDLTTLDPDFFFSNVHKWLYVPRPCAILYVPERHQHLMRSTIPTSHGFVPKGRDDQVSPLPPSKHSGFVHSFEFVASVDNSPYLCFKPALEWRGRVVWEGGKGEEAIYGYCVQQAREAGRSVAKVLGTRCMGEEGDEARKCAFVNVRLPLDFQKDAGGDKGRAIRMAQWMSERLVEEKNTFIAFFFYADAWWVRLSGQIYLTMDDFKWGGEVLKDVCERAKRGEWERK